MTELTLQVKNATIGLPEAKAADLSNAFNPLINGLTQYETWFNKIMAHTAVTVKCMGAVAWAEWPAVAWEAA